MVYIGYEYMAKRLECSGVRIRCSAGPPQARDRLTVAAPTRHYTMAVQGCARISESQAHVGHSSQVQFDGCNTVIWCIRS